MSCDKPALVLASASPRRLELLRLGGIEPLVDPAHVDEVPDLQRSPKENAIRFAADKAQAVAQRHPSEAVLGADTIVTIDGRLLGKPVDADHARWMLGLLSGRRHRVVTALTLVPPCGAAWALQSLAVTTQVLFRPLGEREIAAYLDSQEWRDKAGGYAIQGRAAAFARGVVGSYTNVVGLPLCEVVELLKRVEVLR